MEYPKIDTLFERDSSFIVDPNKLKRSVLGTIKEWDVTEKIDGTNIRVMFTPEQDAGGGLAPNLVGPSVDFNGRTNNAQLPGDLVQYLVKTFPPEKFFNLFQSPIILYGEGYGGKIQSPMGNLYRPDGTKSFILFDVLVDGKWWLNTEQVREVAGNLGIDCVPYMGRMSLDAIVESVRLGFNSALGNRDFPSEGIVARPIDTLFDKRHERVIIKLKTKDFKGGKK